MENTYKVFDFIVWLTVVLLAEVDYRGKRSCFGKWKSSEFEKCKQGLKCLLDFPRPFGSSRSSLE